MGVTALLRSRIKAARKRGALWVRLLDIVRLLPSAEGRGRLWTRIVHGGELHQTSPDTAEDRYPDLFDLVARLAPDAERILSFGCSTGEEMIALRRRFPSAEILGAEINRRSRAIARRRLAGDSRAAVVPPGAIAGSFDLVFALAVFQREPHKVAEMAIEDLSAHYPFARFDTAVAHLVGRLRDGGLLCVVNAQYRVEDSSVAAQLRPVSGCPRSRGLLFGRDGNRLEGSTAATIFQKGGRVD